MQDNLDFSNYNLHIIQTNKHAKSFIKNYLNKKFHIALPVSIEARYLLDQKKINYLIIDDIFGIDKECYFKNVYIKKINKFISSLESSLNHFSIEYKFVAEAYRFQFEVILGNLFLLEEFKNQILNLNFKKIICYETFTLKKFVYDYRPNPRSILFSIFNNECNKTFIQEKILFGDFFIYYDEFKNIARNNIWKYLRPFIKRLRDRNTKNNSFCNYLLLGGEYDWPIYLSKRNININRFYRKLNFTFNSNKKDIKLLLRSVFKKNLPFNSSFYKKFLEPLISRLSNDLDYIISNKKLFQELIMVNKAIITSVVVDPIEAYICFLFKENNKDVFLWQHGENGIISQRDIYTESSELRICTKYLAYTKLVGLELNNQFKFYLKNLQKPKFYSVGTVHKKNKEISNTNKNKRIILVAGKYFGLTRFFHDLGDPDERLYQIHKSFLKIARNNFKDYEFLIKANNTYMYNYLPYKSHESFNINYFDKFTDLISSARALILDSPSTTLLEASFTSIPIFAVKGRSHYSEKFTEISSKRVIWCNDNLEMEEKLQNFLNTGNYEADLKDNKLMENYLGLDDNEAIWSKVDKILKN